MGTAGAAVTLAGVAHGFDARGGGRVQALEALTLTVGPGEIVAVVGPSGCGKSTLLELVCGLQIPDAGTVSSPRAVLMPQRDLLLPWASALDNAALALRCTGLSRTAARAFFSWSFSEAMCESVSSDFCASPLSMLLMLDPSRISPAPRA